MKKTVTSTIVFCLLILSQFVLAQTVSTFAGSVLGYNDGTGIVAQFRDPSGIAVDPASGTIYVADYNNHRIRKITAAGVVTTFAGGGLSAYLDGTGTAAMFKFPTSIAIDKSGNLYVVDNGNKKIRKITPAGVVSTFAGTASEFSSPSGIAIDASENLYVTDADRNSIRKIAIASGGVSTIFAGGKRSGDLDGIGEEAEFFNPNGIALDTSGNVYVADTFNQKIKKITATGVVTTLAGNSGGGDLDGTGTAASFAFPYAVATDASGNLYVADRDNSKIRKITSSGVVTTLAGSTTGSADGNAKSASFNWPTGIAIDASGNLYVADTNNQKIRKITGAVLSSPTFDLTTSRIKAYPNPSKGLFNIQATDETTLEVFTLSGQKILSKKVNPGNVQLDLTEYSTGVYVLKTVINTKSEFIKLIKE